MNIERLLFFIFNYNIFIIEILFAVSLCGILLLAFKFFTSKEEPSGASPDWNRLEDSIKKILENASTSGGRADVVGSGVPAEIPEGMSETVFIHELQTQLERAQIQLMQKEDEIKKLTDAVKSTEGLPVDSASAPAQTAEPGAAEAAYEEKIKDLESRLNEYSIIEDDIADLSFYKEETVRLQSEVDKLTAELAALKEAEAAAPKAVAPPTPPPAPEVAAPEPTPDVAAIVPEPIDEMPDFMKSDKVAAPTENADFIDNDIMAEFEKAVAEQKAVTEAAKVAKAEAKAEKIAGVKLAQETKVVEVAPASGAEAAIDPFAAAEAELAVQNEAAIDPFAAAEAELAVQNEAAIDPFAAAEAELQAVEQTADSSSEVQENNINIDKMLNEAQNLTALEETHEVQNAIDSTLDTDKLLEEASGMDNLGSDASTEFSEFGKKEGA